MILAIIQARMKSTRLPEKIMLKLSGKEALYHVHSRVKKSNLIDKVVIATSIEVEDDIVELFCKENQMNYYRGSENDVLDRFYKCAKYYGCNENDIIVRITSDCPLIDIQIVDQIIDEFLKHRVDYVSNTIKATYPDGLDAEVFSFKAMEEAWNEAKLSSEREHVTPYIKNNKKFKIRNYENGDDLSFYRWTLDEKKDYELIVKIYDELYNKKEFFDINDILNYINEYPELKYINKEYERDEGNKTSLKNDKIVKGRVSIMFEKSENLLERAKKVTPLGAQTYSKSYRYFCQGKSPYFIERGEGSKVWDVDGNEYIDFICALGPITIGYNDERVNNAIKNQLEKGIVFSQPSPNSVELAEKLVNIIPCAEMVRFVKNGSDATTACVKLARAYTNKSIVFACGYHGMQDWYIGATENNRGVPSEVGSLTKMFKYNDISSLEKLFDEYKDSVAAVILEPFQEDGPNDNFLEKVKKLADENNAILIFDEVKSGFWFALGGASEYFGVTPDMASFGKGMANGMPISVVAGKKDIMELIGTKGVFVSTTFGGESLSIAAALETIKILEEKGTYEHIWKMGNYMIDGLKLLVEKYELEEVVHVKGMAPYCGVDFYNFGDLDYLDFLTVYQHRMIEKGILTLGINNINLSHTEIEIKKYIEASEEAFKDIKLAINNGNIRDIVNCEKIKPIFKR